MAKELLKSRGYPFLRDMQEDKRNVVDKYKGVPNVEIVADLDKSRLQLHVAIENFANDFNIGTVIRNANAFNVAGVHIVGRKHYNRRGAMVTDKYMHMFYHPTIADLVQFCEREELEFIAIDNVPGAQPLHEAEFAAKAMFLYGNESDGVSKEGLAAASKMVEIEQFGSTRSVNVGVASGITMYTYVQRHALANVIPTSLKFIR
ncbi:MAG: RNA methyltransferase [Candidatus Nomurabacteria bacterium]|jgi:tRNA G18 (ribose-2'-O)-methylase SpoU|nr:RNA methyltransferase [Candidatus Nomurabacteria bacterium]